MNPAHTALRFAVPANLLSGRVLLVTGAGQGIGQAVALAAARAGATVVLHGRQAAKLAETYDAIVAAGGAEPAIVILDFATCGEADLEAVALGIRKDFARLDGIVHCAAHFSRLKPLQSQSLDESLLHHKVNLGAPLALTRVALPLLRQTGSRTASSAVVFTGLSQTAGDMPHWGALGLAKAALAAAVRMQAAEWGDNAGVRPHLLVPGPVASPQRRQSHPADDFARLRHPGDVARAYLWLLSPNCDIRAGEPLDLSRVAPDQA